MLPKWSKIKLYLTLLTVQEMSVYIPSCCSACGRINRSTKRGRVAAISPLDDNEEVDTYADPP